MTDALRRTINLSLTFRDYLFLAGSFIISAFYIAILITSIIEAGFSNVDGKILFDTLLKNDNYLIVFLCTNGLN
jgi:hypothetical protein